ncbi:MAG: VacJ family lipoprotein [Opitutales bacterium]|jgi:phospholipid-binding lipoprotein MlaA|nr:VacJ family lipoprotein [Opitutales bacterium]MDP4644370.1 VacJ family lipoprotein [Opitutales bacterium]MDP4777836.1 VacJ family lipoprotein [Opitutales bacterium]MDP4884368.1 VacJ family lipoprotein [Opitutales bacterium]MDP5079875.1 VacJ family lipoprotein [Opitutales bacterium]
MKKLNYKRSALLFSVAFGLIGSLSLSAESAFLSEEDLYEEDVLNGSGVSDPLESINRVTFDINDFVYLNLLQPIADGYTAITPDPVEKGASNFFRNLKYPVRLAGNLLQGRFEGAWVETGRFAINSTIGIAGIFTPADSVEGLEPIPAEDIGQALGSWGVGEGPYLVLPLLGPSNLRDLGGYVGDRAVNPLQEPFSLIDDWDWEWRLALAGSELIATSPTMIERYLQLKGSSIDPYGSMKNGFTQYRRSAIEE